MPPSLDPTAVLERSIEGAQRLLALLERERSALEHGDAAALETCVAEKNRLLDELDRLGRTAPLAAATPGVRENLRRLLERCTERNRVNGRIIELSRRRIQQALALLRGQTAGSELYGPAGTASASPADARPLAKA